MKKHAFTLAEVLITLGIIGVVAALVMPALIANYQKKQAVTQLKKAYSEISQALKMAEVYEGEPGTWDTPITSYQLAVKYILPYLKYVDQRTMKDIRDTYNIKYLRPTGVEEKSFTDLYDTAQVVFLENGTMLSFQTSDSDPDVFIDINGVKPPNRIGRDAFFFSFDREHGLVPYGFGSNNDGSFGIDYDRNIIMEAASPNSYGCNKQSRGMWCAGLIMADGWEIKDDYPW